MLAGLWCYFLKLSSLSRQEDELDEVKQRSLKGNVILSSDRRNGSVLKRDEELKKSGKSICDHTLDLISEKKINCNSNC